MFGNIEELIKIHKIDERDSNKKIGGGFSFEEIEGCTKKWFKKELSSNMYSIYSAQGGYRLIDYSEKAYKFQNIENRHSFYAPKSAFIHA